MELYFLRHGKAEDVGGRGAPDDFSRALTEKGIEEMQAEAKAFEQLGVRPNVILASPLIRAKQTAQIVAKRLGIKAELIECELLAPGCNLERLRSLTAPYGSCHSIMLVGHEPDLSTMVGEITGGTSIELKKGGLALVTTERGIKAGCGVMQWLLPPKVLLGRLA
jgi:phosphohistidine phosphatase